MKAQVYVKLKPSVLDPQGKAILGALHAMGFPEVTDVRQGKVFELELNATDPAVAREKLEAAGKKLLANTVIENFEVKLS